jgi:putative ABC transport system ATP-binding protein
MIRLQNISKEYEDGRIKALQDICCLVEAGEFIALTGPSGSGKSTLLNIISTVDCPTSGLLWIDGKPRDALKPFDRFRARTIGFIFQFHHLLPHLTALENIELAMYPIEKSYQKRHFRALELLRSVGLKNRKGAYPTKLSGGERQRVAVARALANRPGILLADEPTGSVDQKTGNEIMELLLSHCRTSGATILVATHNRDIAHRADRTIHLDNGAIVEGDV